MTSSSSSSVASNGQTMERYEACFPSESLLIWLQVDFTEVARECGVVSKAAAWVANSGPVWLMLTVSIDPRDMKEC